MNSRLIGKARFIEIERVFFETAGVEYTELRGHAGPLVRSGFAAVIETRPDENSAEKVVFANEIPRFANGLTPRYRFIVVAGEFMLGVIGFIAAARSDGAVVFRAYYGLIGIFFME